MGFHLRSGAPFLSESAGIVGENGNFGIELKKMACYN